MEIAQEETPEKTENNNKSLTSEGSIKEDKKEEDSKKPVEEKENRIEKLVSSNNPKLSKPQLYENIGTRVSRLREINYGYERKIKEQENIIASLDEKIKEKQEYLEKEMRGQGTNLGKKGTKGKDKIKLHDPRWVEDQYFDLLGKNEISMKITKEHIKNDPALIKAYKQKESELSQLKNQLNNLIKKTEHIKNEINVLRIENNKHKSNLDAIIEKKEEQNKEMNKISEEANHYLKKKGSINDELISLNKQIDNEKKEHESKMQELNKMIDNTKKIKEFHETLAFEKFSSTKKGGDNKGVKHTSKIEEEEKKLDELELDLIRVKKRTVFLNFEKLILSKKQMKLNNIIEKVKQETGIDNLDKLSSDLILSKKTNTLFESDLKNLEAQKKDLEGKIDLKKKEIDSAYNLLNDTTTKKNEYLDLLAKDLKNEENTKELLNKRLFALNRMIDLMSKGFKNMCLKLNFFDKDFNVEADSSEAVLTKCMDFLERKMIEIIQLNTDPLKEANMTDLNVNKNEKLQSSVINSMTLKKQKEYVKRNECVPSNFNMKSIKKMSDNIAQEYLKNGGN